jgi:hypothetical protein
MREINPGRKPRSEELDSILFSFFENERVAGHSVPNKQLQRKALEIAKQL